MDQAIIDEAIRDKVLEVLSRHEPIDRNELIDQVVPHFTNRATEAEGLVLSIREIIWHLVESREVVLTTDKDLFLPDHSRGLCYQPNKDGDCKCCETALFHLNGGPQIGCAHCQNHYKKIP